MLRTVRWSRGLASKEVIDHGSQRKPQTNTIRKSVWMWWFTLVGRV